MTPPAAERTRLFVILVACAAILFIGTAGWGSLYNQTDGQYAGAAKIMARGGSWLIPENDGIPRLIKPPLLYWSMGGAMKVFGVNEFAARLPDALFLTVWVGICFLIGERMGGSWRGFMAGAVLLSSLGTFTLGRIIMPEPMFSMFIAAAMYCLLRGYENEKQRRLWYLAFWLFGSLASFSKGWHGLLYPLGIAGAVALFNRESRPRLRGLLSWEGALVFLAINLPWYAYIESRFPGYFRNLTLVEHLGHLTGHPGTSMTYTTVPRWQFPLMHLAWFFPWSVLAGGALLAGLVSGQVRLREFLQRLGRSFPAQVIVSWAVIIFVSAVLTGQRQDYYAMAMWPAFALGAAWAIERCRLGPAILATGLISLGGLAGLFFAGHYLATRTADTASRYTAWTTMTNLGTVVWARLALIGLLVLTGLLIACLYSWLLERRGARRRAFAVLFAGALALDVGAAAGYASVSGMFSIASAASAIRDQQKPGMKLAYDGRLDVGSSLMFYADNPILLIDQDPDANFVVRSQGIGRDRFVRSADLVTLWKSGQPLILITESEDLPQWREKLAGPWFPMARCGTQELVRNYPVGNQ